MPGMFDARCQECGKRFGWCGELVDRPPCPRCRHRVSLEDLQVEQARLEHRQELLDRPAAASLSRCASCQAEILWLRTVNNKAMPVDPEPVPNGNVVIEGETARVLRRGEEHPGPRYKSHFATCTTPAAFRRR